MSQLSQGCIFSGDDHGGFLRAVGWFEQEFEGSIIRAKSGILLAGVRLLTPRLLSGDWQ